MTIFIIRYFVRRHAEIEYSHVEKFCELAVEAGSARDAQRMAEELKERAIGQHKESSCDPEIEDDPVEFSVQDLEAYVMNLLNEASCVRAWVPEDEDE